MQFSSSTFLALALYAGSISAQTLTQAPSTVPTTAATQGANVERLVSFLLPSATITSLSPSESAKIIADASSYIKSYTAANPIKSLETQVFIDIAFGSTTPSPQQTSSIKSLLENAESGIAADPSGYSSSLDSLIAPFPFATHIRNYVNSGIDGLRTVVASDVGVSPPDPTSSTSRTSTAGAACPTAMVGGIVGLVAGVVGVGLL